MAVITHAQIPQISLPIAGDYTALPQYMRNAFDAWIDKADTAGTGDTYRHAMIRACLAIGIAVPEHMDIAVCDCLNDGCGCGAIFDSSLPGVVVTAGADPGYNLSRLQCPTCGHDHPRPAGD